jgi:hypothetical protein
VGTVDMCCIAVNLNELGALKWFYKSKNTRINTSKNEGYNFDFVEQLKHKVLIYIGSSNA